MKKECDIVQDLLFGYVDNTLKEGSKELVEEHLKDCKDCQKTLQEMKDDESENKDIEKVEGLKKVNRKMRTRKILLCIVSLLLGAFIVLNGFIFAYYYSEGGAMEIFLYDDISKEDEEKVKEIIYSIDKNADIVYKTREMALESMKKQMKDYSYLLDGYNAEDNVFPASYIVKTDVDKVDKIKEEISKIDGVKNVTTRKGSGPYWLFIARFIYNEK